MQNQTKQTTSGALIMKPILPTDKVALDRKCLFIFLIVIFSYLFALNYFLIPVSDDLYHVTAGNTSLKDCVERYMTFTSRFFEMVLVLLIPRISPIAFDIINSIIGTAFIYFFVQGLRHWFKNQTVGQDPAEVPRHKNRAASWQTWMPLPTIRRVRNQWLADSLFQSGQIAKQRLTLPSINSCV